MTLNSASGRNEIRLIWRQQQHWRSNTLVSTRDLIDDEVDEPFNGAELSESVLEGDWSSPEEDAAWSNL
jgi:hypothetical protein